MIGVQYCPNCGGTGWSLDGGDCPACAGTGEVDARDKLTRRRPTYPIALPGKFAFYLSGTSVVQQDEAAHGYGPAGVELGAAFRACKPVRRGRGESYQLSLTLAALDVLDDYAETCIDINRDGDSDSAEMAAAQTVRDRIRAITTKETS